MPPDTLVAPKIRPRPDGDDRARLLIAAAYELLAEQGLDGLTIRAVLQRTGLARRAFYDSFAGKDDLVLAVFAQTLQLAASHFDAQTQALSGPLERLHFVVAGIVMGSSYSGQLGLAGELQPGRRGAALSREHMRLAESHPGELQSALRPLIAVIAGHLADGMAAGIVRRGDPDLLATLVYNLVSTTVHTELLAEEGGAADPQRRGRLADELWDFCRRAVAA